MKHLILDHFSLQPLYKRCFWSFLTAVGWAFWIYLWKPLWDSVQSQFGLIATDSIGMPHLPQALWATLVSHAVIVAVVVSLFVLWSNLQRRGIRMRSVMQSPQVIALRRLAQSVNLHESDLALWQGAQRMVVIHDESAGWIRHVNVLGATGKPANRQHSGPALDVGNADGCNDAGNMPAVQRRRSAVRNLVDGYGVSS